MFESEGEGAGRKRLADARRVVVKVGSSLLTSLDSGLETSRIESYCQQIGRLLETGREVILVTSGSIAEGCKRLGWARRPAEVHLLQAAAAVGQMGLIQVYEQALRSLNTGSAMVMLTHEDLADRQRYLNARATLGALLRMGVVPIINENDTVATDEIRFGDNDTLGALVANLVEADALIILTDVAGLLDGDPRVNPAANVISSAGAVDATLDQMAGGSTGGLGRGGMVTKVRAARLAARSGAHTVITSGHEPRILERLIEGEVIGTCLTAELNPLAARKRWIAGQLRARGDLVLDAGAVVAIQERGVSLLAVGVKGVSGQFRRGDMVRCLDQSGAVVAQGLTNYSSSEVSLVRGLSSDEYVTVLEHVAEPEIVHRDNLVLMQDGS